LQEAERISTVQEYYFSTKLQQIKKMQDNGLPVINLGIGSPDLSPSEETITALAKSAENPNHHGYQSYKGINALREGIAEWSKKTYEIELNSETEILPLMGSKEGIMHISLAFVNPGDIVLVPNPGYPSYSSAGKIVGANVQYFNLDQNNNWQPDFAQLENLDLSKVKFLWLNYPNMPTGAKANKDTFARLIKLARENNFLLCHDNPYSLILNSGRPLSIFNCEGAKDVCLELNSLSKSHNMAGWRLGWVAGKKELINSVLKVKSNFDSGMFLPIQHAAIEALKNDNSWHERQNQEYWQRKKLAMAIMDRLGCSYDQQQEGMFVWAKIPSSAISAEDFSEEILQKALVFLTPGFIFGSNGEGFVRISLCSKENVLQEALKRINNYLDNKS